MWRGRCAGRELLHTVVTCMHGRARANTPSYASSEEGAAHSAWQGLGACSEEGPPGQMGGIGFDCWRETGLYLFVDLLKSYQLRSLWIGLWNVNRSLTPFKAWNTKMTYTDTLCYKCHRLSIKDPKPELLDKAAPTSLLECIIWSWVRSCQGLPVLRGQD